MMKQPGKDAEREYEKSGLYPKDGKPFRIIALLVGLSAVIAALAVVAAVLDFLLL